LSCECSRNGATSREVRSSHNIAAAPFKHYCAAILQFVVAIMPPRARTVARPYDAFGARAERAFTSSIGNGNTIVEPRSLAMSNSVPR
jgi:hypothetical protein